MRPGLFSARWLSSRGLSVRQRPPFGAMAWSMHKKGRREAARGFPWPSGFWFGRYRAGERCLREARGWAKLKTVRGKAPAFAMPWQAQKAGRRAEVRLFAGQRRVRPAVVRAANLRGWCAGTGGAKRPRQQGGVAPNRACSGRGYAPRRPRRQKFRVESANGGVGRPRPAADAIVGQ